MKTRANTIRVNLGVSIVLVAAVLVIPAVRASGIDLHWLWDDRCASCHGHAGDFARKFLSVSGGELQGQHHTHDLYRFLHNHYLAGNEVDAAYNMLFAQASNQARFKSQCVSCHGTAAGFVRSSLELRNGVLYSSSSGRQISSFLPGHMRLKPDEAEFFTDLLTRVAHEVYRP